MRRIGAGASRNGIVLVAFAVGLFVASWVLPAIGASPSKTSKKALKKAISAETIAKEALAKAGTPGPAGPAGTARAYAAVTKSSCMPPDDLCSGNFKGITEVRRATGFIGRYCVTAPGLRPQETTAVVSVDALDTADPVAPAQASIDNGAGICGDDSNFGVSTSRIGHDVGGLNNSQQSDTVAFTIVIP